MPWTKVTIPRRTSGVAMPGRCAYCNGPAERDVVLHVRRETSRTKGRLTTTRMEEHVEIDVPYCNADAARGARVRRELRIIGRAAAALGAVLGFAAVIVGLDAELGTRIFFGLFAGGVLGFLALLATGILVRRLPRYRDWGAGMLGVDLAVGPNALTFLFTNSTYAATFRTRNGLLR
jgi:hypothetical protein